MVETGQGSNAQSVACLSSKSPTPWPRTRFLPHPAGRDSCDEVYSDDRCLAFRDVAPQAPVHVLVIPREPIPSLREAQDQQASLLGHLLLVAAQVAQQAGLEDWRTVINTAAGAAQTVFHRHVHLNAGRSLAWPPG